MVKRLSISELFAECPTRYEDLSTRQFQNIFRLWDLDKEPLDRNWFTLMKILTGVHIVESPENEIAIFEMLKWVIEQPMPYSSELPEELFIAGMTIKLPKKIGRLSVGQNILLKQKIEGSKFLEENLSYAVAVYIQQLYHDCKKFKPELVEEIEFQVLKMPAEKIYPIGFFILAHVQQNGWRPRHAWQRMISSLDMRLRLMWLRWRKFGDSGRLKISHYWSSTQKFLDATRIKYLWIRLLIR